MHQWRYRRVTSESLGCNLWLNDLEMLRWRGIASHMFRMPHGASTVWHAVLDLTGMRGDLPKESSIPTLSFDFCFTKSLDEGDKEADVSSSTWLAMTDSHSGYLGRCPLRGKS